MTFCHSGLHAHALVFGMTDIDTCPLKLSPAFFVHNIMPAVRNPTKVEEARSECSGFVSSITGTRCDRKHISIHNGSWQYS